MPRRWRRSSCAGSRSRAIRSTSRRWPRSPAYDGALSTGENLFSTQDVENLVRFGGLKAERGDVIQVDPPQAYGIVQYARTLDMLARHNWPRSGLFPHGGNQMSLAIAGGFGLGGAESYPGVFGAFAGFADDAPAGERLPEAAGPPRHRLRGAGGALPHHARSCSRGRALPKLAMLHSMSGGQAAHLEGAARARAAAAAACARTMRCRRG